MHEKIFPIGPQHPSLKEPIFLKLHVDGSYITKAEFNLGYTHRGVEKCAEGYLLDTALHAVQRTCGICSQCHSMAFLNAVEPMTGVQVPEKVYLQRLITAELERIHSHLLWGGVMAHEIGLETLFMYYWREREHILDIFDELTGNRVHHSPDLIGTAKRSFNKENLQMVLEKLDLVEPEIKELRNVMENHDVITSRFKKHGNIPKKMAEDLDLVGPTARASGVNYDVRQNAPYMAYGIKELKVKPVIRSEGDSWGRTMIRCDEIFESMRLVRKACEMIDPNEEVPKKKNLIAKGDFSRGRTEAPRGENFHFVAIENNRIKRLKLRTPTLANVISYARIMEGEDITDVPVIVMSLDPCISCMERVAVIRNGKQENWTSHELFEGKKYD
ncbi:nickel-dependent hydrogenase large subunit [Candidatus Micrarchaeota archaeon]|nr:nickel-dependent hydrogenase large subunit [Candidatus Micrarchaeota archaeon]